MIPEESPAAIMAKIPETATPVKASEHGVRKEMEMRC